MKVDSATDVLVYLFSFRVETVLGSTKLDAVERRDVWTLDLCDARCLTKSLGLCIHSGSKGQQHEQLNSTAVFFFCIEFDR